MTIMTIQKKHLRRRIHEILKEHLRVKFNGGYPIIVGIEYCLDDIMDLIEELQHED